MKIVAKIASNKKKQKEERAWFDDVGRRSQYDEQKPTITRPKTKQKNTFD